MTASRTGLPARYYLRPRRAPRALSAPSSAAPNRPDGQLCLLAGEGDTFATNSAVLMPSAGSGAATGAQRRETYLDGSLREAMRRYHPETARDFAQGAGGDSSAGGEGGGGGSLISLAVAMLFLADNPSYSLVIAGHTDAVGARAQNRALSELRARSVKHLLLGERQPWVDLAVRHHAAADGQRALAHVARVTAWDCDPGAADGVSGPMTQRALRAFQASYNTGRGRRIEVDGVLGPATWGAIFDVYQAELAALLGVRPEALGEARRAVRVLDTLAFGEAVRQIGARRVDLLFLANQAVPLRNGGEPNPALYQLDFLIVEPIPWSASISAPPPAPSFSITDNRDHRPLPPHPLDAEHRDTVEVGPTVPLGDDPWAFLDAMARTGPWNEDRRDDRRSRSGGSR